MVKKRQTSPYIDKGVFMKRMVEIILNYLYPYGFSNTTDSYGMDHQKDPFYAVH